MKPTARNIFISVWLGLGSGIVCVSHAADNPNARTPEARQLTEDFSPQAQYDRSRREAQAAYGEAVKQCNAQERSERQRCIKDAKAQLQDDLTYAKQNYNRARQTTAYDDSRARFAGMRREAYAAYDEHRQACNSMSGTERTSCMKEARSYLQEDLAYARNQANQPGMAGPGSETATGSSGIGGSSASGR